MTEELLKLTDKIKDAVEKNVSMEQKKEGLLAKLGNVMEDNYNKLIAEEVKIYNRLAEDLKLKYKCEALYNESGLKLRYAYSDGTEAYLKSTHGAFNEYFNFRYSYSDQSGHQNENWIRAFSRFLDTEEHTIQMLEQIRKGYSAVFSAYLEYIDAENAELAKDIESLSESLASSSVIKEEEDGTVEIHLGNKVFRGKLTEE